ncbi:MAG: hypothetical protein QOH51_3937 [Acidobacteriota bacterium]|jgi:hypothetical protein|nr:hypothetical protein [Acidobacteriota bacterium]
MENIQSGSLPAENVEVAGLPSQNVEVAGRPAKRRSLSSVLNSRPVLLIAGALLVGAVFWYLQFSTGSLCCGDYDAYYHFGWSRMLWQGMRTGHFPPSFDSLPLTTLNARDYVDHHFLFHILQIPFTWFSDFQTGAKIGTWLFSCLAVFSCYWLMLRNRLSYPLVWLVAVTGSSAPFLYRMSMGKAMSVSIVLLVIGIHLMFERKYRWLLPLAFVFALTYDMVFLLCAASLFWLFVVMWQERALNREVWWAAAAFGLVLAGSLLGFVINPYFPHNFQLLYEHLIIKVTAKDFSTAVGSEWYPYTTWEFLGNCGVALVAMVVGYVAFKDSSNKGRQRAFFLLLFSTFLMIVNMRWRRFAEYFPPFAVLFAAFAVEPLIRHARERFTARESVAADSSLAADSAPIADFAPAADSTTEPGERTEVGGRTRAPEKIERARAWEVVLVSTAFVLLAAPLVWYAYVTSKDIAGMAGPNFYQGGSEWLSKNADRGELILNTDWDDFPKLFFYNPQLAYVSGLDPTYLLDKDQKLSELHAKITIGKDLSDEEVANLGPIIRDNFCVGEGAGRRCVRYVFTDHEHEDFYNNALDSGWFDEVYSDGDCAILRLRAEKGAPPPDNAPPGDDNKDADDTDEGNDPQSN